jgi:hypothetical protein
MARALAGAMLAVAVAAYAADRGHAEEGRHLDVVEMFTSQACSACPPADELLGELAQEDGILVLSYSVDYWNYLEWEDTLAEPDFSTRQRAYAKQRGDREVFTPQAIINGLVHAVGSDRRAIDRARAATGPGDAPTVSLSVARGNPSSLAIEIGAAPDGLKVEEATLWLVVYADSRTVKIRAGENKGRTLTYHNVVRAIRPVARWTGEKLHTSIAAPEIAGKRCAILLQEGNAKSPGRILAAGRL